MDAQPEVLAEVTQAQATELATKADLAELRADLKTLEADMRAIVADARATIIRPWPPWERNNGV